MAFEEFQLTSRPYAAAVAVKRAIA